MTKFTYVALLSLVTGSCAAIRKSGQNPSSGSPAPSASPSSLGSHPNFFEFNISNITRDDSLTSSSASKLCHGKSPGSVFIAIGSTFASYVCLGSDSDDALGVYHFDYKASEVRSIYLGSFSDTVTGVTDYSAVSIYETDNLISAECKYTDNSQSTLTPGPLAATVKKSDINALRALESGSNSGKGICSNVYLVSYKDLTKAVLYPGSGDQKQFRLVKIYP